MGGARSDGSTTQCFLFFSSHSLRIHLRSRLTQTGLPPLLFTSRPGTQPSPFPPALVSSGTLICATLQEAWGAGGRGGGGLPGTHAVDTQKTHRPVLTAYSNYRPSLSHGLHLCSEQITCDPIQHAAGGRGGVGCVQGGLGTHTLTGTYTHTKICVLSQKFVKNLPKCD